MDLLGFLCSQVKYGTMREASLSSSVSSWPDILKMKVGNVGRILLCLLTGFTGRPVACEGETSLMVYVRSRFVTVHRSMSDKREDVGICQF